jgi:hypothetical protein
MKKRLNGRRMAATGTRKKCSHPDVMMENFNVE